MLFALVAFFSFFLVLLIALIVIFYRASSIEIDDWLNSRRRNKNDQPD